MVDQVIHRQSLFQDVTEILFRILRPEQGRVDDLVYHGSLVAFHKNQLDRCADDMPLNDTALYHLINVGVQDMDAIDKLWDASTRSM